MASYVSYLSDRITAVFILINSFSVVDMVLSPVTHGGCVVFLKISLSQSLKLEPILKKIKRKCMGCSIIINAFSA